MNIARRAAVLAASLSFAFATPALAQNFPLSSGNFVSLTGITVDDGHALDYANWLATYWREQEEFAKKNGWTTGYEILANVHKRTGEPDLYLVRRFRTLPDAVESEKREQMIRDQVKQTDAQMEAASGERAKFRHVGSEMLLRELRFK